MGNSFQTQSSPVAPQQRRPSKILAVFKHAGVALCVVGVVASAMAAASFGVGVPMANLIGAGAGFVVGVGLGAAKTVLYNQTGGWVSAGALFRNMLLGGLAGEACGYFALPGAMIALKTAGGGLLAGATGAGVGMISGAASSLWLNREKGFVQVRKLARNIIVHAAAMGLLNMAPMAFSSAVPQPGPQPKNPSAMTQATHILPRPARLNA